MHSKLLKKVCLSVLTVVVLIVLLVVGMHIGSKIKASKKKTVEFESMFDLTKLKKNTDMQKQVNDTNAGIADAIRQETAEVTAVDAIPVQYRVRATEGGRIELITYKTKDYFGDKEEVTKSANVYLPIGYDGTKQYSVLYLMHGIGGDEAEWGMTVKSGENESSMVKKIMDNLTVKGEIESFIIVTPNGRSSRNYGKEGSDFNSFYKFGEELRNDLIPYMDSHYSTYADREHRAMAGLSMGGMQTINIGICECLDLISWFGAFSAAPTSYQSTRIASVLENNSNLGINYFYNICGLEDSVAYAAASGAAKFLPSVAPSMKPGENFQWHEVHGGHDFNVWYLGFYNFARIIFQAKLEK